MKPISSLLAMGIALAWAGAVLADPKPESIDFERAKQLFERVKKGETLTDDEKAYVERAKAEHARQAGEKQGGQDASGIDWEKAKGLYRREQSGEKLTEEEEQYLNRAKAARGQRPGAGGGRPGVGEQRKAPEHLAPLSDMGANDHYEGEDGGLYGGGQNTPPGPHLKAATAALGQIKPIDGKIVLVSISMSNATMEFSSVKNIADRDARKSGHLTIVDFAGDGTHPSESGREKVAKLLLEFFATDPLAKGWFTK